MKKTLLLLIALFMIGEMTRANEALITKDVLKKETKSRHTVRPMEVSEPNYWVAAEAHFDKYGWFDPTQLADVSYKARVDIDGTTATISGILDISDYYVTAEYPIEGTYDPEAKTITVNTPVYDSNNGVDAYTKIGQISYYGSDVTLVLFAGQFVYDESVNDYGLATESQLVFDVADDMTLTPRTGYGAYGFYSDGSQAGFLNFYKSATWQKMGEEAKLLIAPEEMEISGTKVTVGATVTRDFTLSNIGTTGTSYTVEVNFEDLQVYASDAIAGSTTDNYRIEFIPTHSGEYSGWVKFRAANGSTATMQITATVSDAPDFSSIVKNGELAFSFLDDLPFELTNELTGFPVAASTNELSEESSSLCCNAYVPEGKVGVLSWKGESKTMLPNGASIVVNGEEVFNNTYTFSGYVGTSDLANTIILNEGNNVVEYTNWMTLNWYLNGTASEPFKMYLYDFDFQLIDKSDNAALLKDESADFGRHYFDKYAVSDTAVVRLANIGSNPLRVTGFRGSNGFSGVVDGAEAEYGKELVVKLLFTGENVGEYSGSVVIETTAGEFTVACTASTEPIIYDYTPVVTGGEFSFNTSMEYPFLVEGNAAISSTAYCSYEGESPVSWLEASFKVEEGTTATLSWIGNNSSADYFNFMGTPQHNDGTVITIDGSKVKDYAGEMDASSSSFAAEDLTFGPGLHKVNFLYKKIYSEPEGLDRFKLSDLNLTVETSGVDENVALKVATSTEIYNVAGQRIDAMEQGVNIVRTTYSDGTVKTVKVVK